MKKSTLLLLFNAFVLLSYSQIAQNTESQLTSNAEKWFKDVYVESSFKDPYSYRHLKTFIKPISHKDFLESRIKEITAELKGDNLDLMNNKVNPMIREEAESLSNSCKENIKTYLEKIANGSISDYERKRMEIYKKYLIQVTDQLKQFDLHDLNIEEKTHLEEKLLSLTQEEANSTIFHEIRIDCYSKNSLGNEVLGRFSFPFSKDGVLGNKGGIDQVTQLNKD